MGIEEKILAEMQGAFQEIQQPRSDYQLANFVVFEKDTETAAYAQCVLELQIKWNAIRRGRLNLEKLKIEAARLRRSGDAVDEIEAQLKEVDADECELAMLGAMREAETLYGIWRSFPKQFTHSELQAGQTDYWHARLQRQAVQDIMATGGRIAVGNQDALRMAGIKVGNNNGNAVFELPSGDDKRRGAPALLGD